MPGSFRFIISLFLFQFYCLLSNAQELECPPELAIDSSFAFLQYYDKETAEKFVSHFDNSGNDKVVIFHYGGSHIQAERPTTFARKNLQDDFGNGGRGMIFNYGAANTYSSVNYSSTAKGNWVYAKSFQIPPKIPLGVCGMSVETTELNAELNFKFKETIPSGRYKILLFIQNDTSTFDFVLNIDTSRFYFDKQSLKKIGSNTIELTYTGSIDAINITTTGGVNQVNNLRFYGLDIENVINSGVVYHSLGVGAAPFRSVLYLDKMPEHAAELKPDIVILDFGTNDILYHNKIDPKLPDQIRKAIRNFRQVNPEIIIILTSTQDLYYKGKYITAGPLFRNLVDSLAKEQKCMFWNWYDLSGGLRTIRTWYNTGFAKSDCIHLTQDGYRVKGEFLYHSFKNTIDRIKMNPDSTELRIPMRDYTVAPITVPGATTDSIPKVVKTVPASKKYRVKSGDTLSQIAQKHRTTVAKIKKLNGLKSDLIHVGQILKIP